MQCIHRSIIFVDYFERRTLHWTGVRVDTASEPIWKRLGLLLDSHTNFKLFQKAIFLSIHFRRKYAHQENIKDICQGGEYKFLGCCRKRERERRRTTAVKRPSKKEKIAKIETVHGHIECVSKSVSVHCVS